METRGPSDKIYTNAQNQSRMEEKLRQQFETEDAEIAKRQSTEEQKKRIDSMANRMHLYGGREKVTDEVQKDPTGATKEEAQAIKAKVLQESDALEKVRSVGIGALPKGPQGG